MILSCNNISKSFGTDIILSNCSFNIENHEKAAIVGPNGAGKSTLLKIIVGELPSDTGVVTLAKDTTLGYLAQHQNLTSENTIYDELLTVKQDIIDMENKIRSMEADMNNLTGEALENLLNQYTRLNHEFELKNGYAYKSEIYGVLKGLGFTEEDFSLCVNTLSGGQKTRVALGKLLLSKPDIILLDEPTAFLDLPNRYELCLLLKKLAQTEGKCILFSTHDLDIALSLCDTIMLIDNPQLYSLPTNEMITSGHIERLFRNESVTFDAQAMKIIIK